MKEDEFDGLVERAHQIREMQAQPGWELYVDWVMASRLAPNQTRLLDGKCNSMEEYTYSVGYRMGCSHALTALDALERQIQGERERRAEQTGS